MRKYVKNGQVTYRTFNAANRLMTVARPTGPISTYTQDANGNEIGTNTGWALTTMAWSPENKLVSSSLPDGTVQTNTFGADGRRRSKTKAGSVTSFREEQAQDRLQEMRFARLSSADFNVRKAGSAWDDFGVLLETDPSLDLVNRYTKFPDEYGGLGSQHAGGASTFFGFDTSANTRVLLGAGGAVTDNYSNTAFGVELQSGSGSTNSRRFGGGVGYERDWSDWYVMDQRPYDAVNGTFPSPDELGFDAGDSNWKRYVGNNPVKWTDPKGLQAGTWDPGPTPPESINSRRSPIAGCNAVADCLNAPSRPRCGCNGKPPGHIPNSIELMVCISWQETNRGTRIGRLGQPPGGVARCTESCFDTLVTPGRHGKDNCSYLSKYKSYGDFRRNATSCEKLWAAQDYLACVGLDGFGPPYSDSMKTKLTDCEACIRGGCTNVAIANAGYPCAIARGCVKELHN